MEDLYKELGVGRKASLEEIHTSYKELAKKYHPDKNKTKGADEKFAKISRAYHVLSNPTTRRVYDDIGEIRDKPVGPTVINVKGVNPILVGDLIGTSLVSNVYKCEIDTKDFRLKVCKVPNENGSLAQELKFLKDLNQKYFPKVITSFLTRDATGNKQALVTTPVVGHTPEEILKVHSEGADPRDVAWMANRFLEGLDFAHQSGIITLALIPSLVHLDTESHGVTFGNLEQSVPNGAVAKLYSNKYKWMYPPEFLAKKAVGPSTDFYLWANLVKYLLGQQDIPTAMNNFLKSCLIANPARRPDRADLLRNEWGGMLRGLYGPPKFRPFLMSK